MRVLHNRCINKSTDIIAIHQWTPLNCAPTSNSDNPIREMVVAIVSGPMNFNNKPTTPKLPKSTWNTADIIMAPWIWNDSGYD